MNCFDVGNIQIGNNYALPLLFAEPLSWHSHTTGVMNDYNRMAAFLEIII